MTAPLASPPPKTLPKLVLPRGSTDRSGRVPLTVTQYHAMIEAGILPEGERIELIGGELRYIDRSDRGEDPMSVGLKHAFAITALTDLNAKLSKHGCYVRIQLPVTLPEYDEPEPDACIVRGDIRAYVRRRPGPGDILCVIEASDSSLARDRGDKLAAYANAGVRVYIILNLIDNVAEVYTEPQPGQGRYGRSATLGPRAKLELPTGGGKPLVVAVGKLLP